MQATSQIDEVKRSEEARQIMESVVFKKAVAEIEAGLLDGIKRSALVDSALRDKCCIYYTLLHKLLDGLATTIDTGKLAARQLEIEQQQRSWTDRFKKSA